MDDNNSTRHKSSVALILIDIINHFEFPDGDKVLKNVLPMANRLAKLKQRCRRAGIPGEQLGRWWRFWRYPPSDRTPFTILFGGLGSLTASQSFEPVTATGYTSNGVTGLLYSKGAASTPSEDGLGLQLDPTGDIEIYDAPF